MRVTRESLIRIARETAQERAYNDPGIITAYLTGSLATPADPMLGGTTDIDLVLIHTTPPALRREIVKLTPDFHLDILHRTKTDLRSPRELRADPVLGCEMYDPLLLYQREKFFEFVQAGLRAGFEFHAPALALARCRTLLAEARQCWIDLSDLVPERAGATQVRQFLRGVERAANSLAELHGAPLAERRFLLDFPSRAQATERHDFTATLFGLLGAADLETDRILHWLTDWEQAFLQASKHPAVEAHIHEARLNYYKKAIRSMLEGEIPTAVLWPLLYTWTSSVSVLSEAESLPWKKACEHLGLLGQPFLERIQELDRFIDEIEICLDAVATANGWA